MICLGPFFITCLFIQWIIYPVFSLSLPAMSNGSLARMLAANPYAMGTGAGMATAGPLPGKNHLRALLIFKLLNLRLNFLLFLWFLASYGTGSAMYGAVPNMGVPMGSAGAASSAALQRNQISNLWMTNAPGAYQRTEPGAEDEEVAAEDEDDMGVIETYSNYMPPKLKVCSRVTDLFRSRLPKLIPRSYFSVVNIYISFTFILY